MGIIDDVMTNAKSAATVVGKKAGELVDISKLKLSAADLNGDIAKKLQTLGRFVYAEKKEQLDNSEQIAACISELEEMYEQLDAINEQVVVLRHKTICPNCKKENTKDAVYCNACGSFLGKEKNEE